MDFLDENIILVTQKTGKIIKINLKNEIFEEINGLPIIFFKGQGGLLDITVKKNKSNTKISDKKMELCKTCGVFVAKDLAIFEGKSIYCSKKCINLK